MPAPTPTATFHHDIYPAIDPSKPSLSAAGKTVLITGGGQGLGVSFAEAFSTAGAANIVLLGRKLETLTFTKSKVEKLPTNKSKVYTWQADITDKGRVDGVFAEVAETVGKIDIYISNAGYLPTQCPVAETDIKEFETALSINTVGALITVQAFLKHKADTSTLIYINSATATFPYMGTASGYVASKAASARLMDQVAGEHTDVRVFNLHPGQSSSYIGGKPHLTDTGLVKTAMADVGGLAKVADDTPQLSGGFAVWLASPEADFLRGRFVWSNWDVDELKQMEKDGEFERNEALFQFNLVGWPFKYSTKLPWE